MNRKDLTNISTHREIKKNTKLLFVELMFVEQQLFQKKGINCHLIWELFHLSLIIFGVCNINMEISL